jgi:hypothetical protein
LTSSLSGLKNRSENSAGRGQILPVLQVNSRSIDQKSGEICTGQADLQPISFKSDRLLDMLRDAGKLWVLDTKTYMERSISLPALLKQAIRRNK